MYHTIVRRKVRKLWQRVGNGDYQAAVAVAAPRLHFRFAGGPPLGADLHGPDEFRRWFAGAFALLPGLRMTVTDLVVRGWPWNTTVVVRLAISATLSDGTPYTNEAVQWVRLRWGQMTDDYVLEDTARLADAASRQQAAAAARPQGSG
jgi:ketosteroid isomerase-like protein